MEAGKECALRREQGSAVASFGMQGECAVPGAITAFYTGASTGFNIFGKIDGLK
jgi:hypothetical protein